MPIVEVPCPIRKVTTGPSWHFFGYYDKTTWDRSGRYLLALQIPSTGRHPTPDSAATIGLVDLEDQDRFRPFAQTTAWSWQQGAMVQWLESSSTRQVIYNTRTPDGYGSTICDTETGGERSLPLPAYAVSSDGRTALTVNYDRLGRTHPTIGYLGSSAADRLEDAPPDDGIHILDLRSGDSKLVVTLEQLARTEPDPSMAGAIHWCSHLAFNATDSRFLFLHRWSQRVEDQATWFHRLFTGATDGSEITLLERTGQMPSPETGEDDAHFQAEKYSYMISHAAWRDETHILAWSHHKGQTCYHLYRDQSEQVLPVGVDALTENGHCTYSPDRRWILTDTYPDPVSSKRSLLLYEPDSNTRVDIGCFHSPAAGPKEDRCDLHPRWSRDGQSVCIDSMHEGGRQMYIIDVSSVVTPVGQTPLSTGQSDSDA